MSVRSVNSLGLSAPSRAVSLVRILLMILCEEARVGPQVWVQFGAVACEAVQVCGMRRRIAAACLLGTCVWKEFSL